MDTHSVPPVNRPVGRPSKGVAASRARLIPLWPVFVFGLCVSLVAVYGLLRLQDDNDRSQRLAVLLAQFEGAVARQNCLS